MAKKKSKVVVQVRPAKSKAKKAKVSEKEIGLLGKALRAMGTSAGSAIGGYFGNPVAGASSGYGLGAAISRWLGSGDYTVTSNSIVNSVRASGSIPAMHSSGQSVVVRHKEFVMTVRSSIQYAVQRSLPINPGRAEVFPWLSRLANCYQQYRIKGMVFHYVPTSGNAVTGSAPALGCVMLQTSYRSNDAPPSSKVELLNEYWSTETVPSDAACHPIECNPSENPFNVQYVRSDDRILPPGDSPLLYDLGMTHVATEGQLADGVALGDLWVTYEIELKKPILSSNVTNSIAGFGYMRTNTTSLSNLFGGVAFNTGVPYTLPWTTGTTNNIFIPSEWAGTVHFVISVTGTWTEPKMLGAPTVVGPGSVINWAPPQDRYEFNSGNNADVPSIKYCFAVRKLVVGQGMGITVPTPTRVSGSGSLLVEITAFGRRNEL
jgi:hypothetical protein